MTTPFVDTNVVVYSVDRSDPTKRAAAKKLLNSAPRPRMSPQVLRETYSVLTASLKMRSADAEKIVAALAPAVPVVEDAGLVVGAIAASQRWQISVWDALIVEAARRAGCDEVLSEDLQDGMDFDGVRVRNPFR